MITYALLNLCGRVSYGLGPLSDELEHGAFPLFIILAANQSHYVYTIQSLAFLDLFHERHPIGS